MAAKRVTVDVTLPQAHASWPRLNRRKGGAGSRRKLKPRSETQVAYSLKWKNRTKTTSGSLGVEKVPGSGAELHELLALLPLALGAVPTGAEWSSALGSWTMTQWRAAVLILGAGSAPACAAAGINSSASRGRGRRRRRLVSVSIVNDLREQFGTATGDLVLCLFR